MDLLHQESIDRLFQAILSLKSLDECYEFFEDACTIKEIQEIAQRYEVATLLWKGKSYGEINQATGASTATICRVKKCLVYGNSGYKIALERMQEDNPEE